MNTACDDLHVIDLSSSFGEEDSWLFTSPNSSSGKKVSPYKWVRQDLEKDDPEVENTRKKLVFRLDDATKKARTHRENLIGGSSYPNAAPSEKSSHNNNFISDRPRQRSNLSATDYNQYDTEHVYNSSDGARVNSNTFRLKKKPQNGPISGLARPEVGDVSPRNFRGSPRESVERERLKAPPAATRNTSSPRYENGDVRMSRQSSEDSNSLESPREQPPEYNKLTDVVDVQVLARMQEDSLRKSMTSPAQFSNKKALSKPNLMNGSYSSPRSNSLRYHDNDSTTPQQSKTVHSNNSLASAASSLSSGGSPGGSPYGSQQLQHDSPEGQETLRRSMPNLAKTMPMSLPSHPSDPELDQTDINTQTFTRRRAGASQLEKAPKSLYGSGGLAGRTTRQGISSAYQRTQSPAAAHDARASASPQPRAYNVRNVSPVRQARNVSPVRQARNVSPVRQARNVSPVWQARNVSPVRQARNVSPVRQARNVSPVRVTSERRMSPTPSGRRMARNVSPVNNGSGYRVRNVSPVQNNAVPHGRTSPSTQGVSPRYANSANQRTMSHAYSSPGFNTNTITKSRSSAQATTPRSAANYSPNGLQHQPAVTSLVPRAGAKSAVTPMRSSSSGLPAPKTASGLPRPGSASSSKLPSPKKLAIPASRRAALFNKTGDDSSWKDGCY